MEQEINRKEELHTLKNKIEILIAGRLRRKNNLARAICVQDDLSKKSGSWNGAEEIKKWRQKR
ncbi:hypothetical protein J4462_00780 [Candidatus Pacearchaeota archaeon]|nr:hypothetical protein [Candidatus Pacearchaeota archaeon]